MYNFLTSNKKGWDKKIVKSPEGKCNIRQMRKNHIITPIVSISSLKALRATLIDIDSYFAFIQQKKRYPPKIYQRQNFFTQTTPSNANQSVSFSAYTLTGTY